MSGTGVAITHAALSGRDFAIAAPEKSARVSPWPITRGRIRLKRRAAGQQRWWTRIHPTTSAHGRIAIGPRLAHQVAGQSQSRLSGVCISRRPGEIRRPSRRNDRVPWGDGCSHLLCGPSLRGCSPLRCFRGTATDVSKLQSLGSQAGRPPSCGHICRGRSRPHYRRLATRVRRERFRPRRRCPSGMRGTLHRTQRTSRMPRARAHPARRWKLATRPRCTSGDPSRGSGSAGDPHASLHDCARLDLVTLLCFEAD